MSSPAGKGIFPPPPRESYGWPWNQGRLQTLNAAGSEGDWPRISIVTPSYNQAQFLEETIRSVLMQGYPNLDYLVIDGGSSDGSVEIIRKYSPWLAYWVSEPDRGQAHAINKGFARSTGSLVGWVNSDDVLLPGALATLALANRRQPNAILVGDVFMFVDATEKGRIVHPHNVTTGTMLKFWQRDWYIHQSGTYIPRELAERVGWLNENLRYFFDHDWLCRLLLANSSLTYLQRPLLAFRIHDESKTIGESFRWGDETLQVLRSYRPYVTGLDERTLEAGHYLHQASIDLSLIHSSRWSRRAAFAHLSQAVALNGRLLWHLDVWKIMARLLAPKWLARKLTAAYFSTSMSEVLASLAWVN